MTLQLTDDQRRAIQEHRGEPIYLVDADTNTTYVLMRAEQFEKVQKLLREEFDPREAYTFLDRVMREDDADDPALESYRCLPKQPS